LIEQSVFTLFKQVANEIGADFEPMYQTPNPAELYGIVTTRISAGIPCIFCRVVDIPSTSQDTDYSVYNGLVTIEIILAQTPLQEFDHNIFSRGIYTVRDKFINSVRQKRTLLLNDPRDIRFRFTSLGRSLFRDSLIDALALSCQRNFTIDFDETFQ